MAGLSTRKRGSKWEYRFEGAKIGNKRNQISKGGFDTKKAALEAGTKALAEYNHTGTYFIPSEISVSDFLDKWYNEYALLNLKDTTLRKYEMYIRVHIKPAIGIYKLKALTTETLQKFINQFNSNGYSRNTMLNIKSLLTGSLNYAIDTLHLIPTNPAIAVRLPNQRSCTKKKERVALTKEQLTQIFDRFPEGHSSYIPLLIGYHCGLRIGEMFALTWDDIDFVNKTLTVNKQIQWIDKSWKFTEPKYGSSRIITIDDMLLTALENYKNRQINSKNFYGTYYTTLYVSSNGILNTTNGIEIDMVTKKENGDYLQSRSLQHTSNVIHNSLKIKEFDYHTLRHTHTTNLIEANVNVKEVQHRLGHKNIKATLEIYTSYTDKISDDTRNKLNDMY